MQDNFTNQTDSMPINENNGSNNNYSEKRFPKAGPIAAIVVMCIELAIFNYIMGPVQYYFGMWGLVITELSLVVITCAAAWVVGLKFKDMIHIKRITAHEFFGTIFVWIAALLFVMIANLAFFYFFPAGLEVNQTLNDFTSQWAALPALFVVAVMPAVCEEFFQRGFIQTCMARKLKSRILLSFVMGLFFGLFHMDFYRFLGTAILGGFLSYILIVTDNFFYNMLFHFINNFSAQLLMIILPKLPGGDVAAATVMTKEVIALAFASYLVIGCIAPLLMFGGSLLLKGKQKIAAEGKPRFFISLGVAIGLAGIMAVSGMVLMVILIMNGAAIQ